VGVAALIIIGAALIVLAPGSSPFVLMVPISRVTFCLPSRTLPSI
jgi:hypothetical protein